MSSIPVKTVGPRIDHPFKGFAFGLLGVITFSLTLPFTRLAVAALDPFFVGLGRAVVAAMLAGPLLCLTRQPLPTKPQWKRLCLVGAGVVVGFPVLSTWAMHRVPASHGAVVLGLLPLATALAGIIRTHERPSIAFWIASMVGSFTVIGFALSSGGGKLEAADIALLGAVIAAALGYAEGGSLSREMGGWQVICWALLLMLPLTLVPVVYLAYRYGLHAPASAWLGFGYVSVFSMFLGFFAWYRGLALGGISRISQLQLLQPFLTLAFSALMLGEHLSAMAIISALVVASSIFLGRKTPIRHSKAVVIGKTGV
jgi:drug/metabolite transporter (DMT)-like permease